MMRVYLIAFALNGLLAVALGAFGAHGLQQLLSTERLATWDTAVQYQMFHSIALLAVGLLSRDLSANALLRWSGRLFVMGLLVFCGSLYLLALTDIRWLGAITPLGGVAWLAAWALLAKIAFDLPSTQQ